MQIQSSHHSMDPDKEILIPQRKPMKTIMMIERTVPIPDTPVLQHLSPGRAPTFAGSWPTEQSDLDDTQGHSSHHILIPHMPCPDPPLESKGQMLPPKTNRMGIERVTPALPPWQQERAPTFAGSWPTEQSDLDNMRGHSSPHSMDPDNQISIRPSMGIERVTPALPPWQQEHLSPARAGSWPTEQSDLDNMQGHSSPHSMDPDNQILIRQMPGPRPSMGIERVTPSLPLRPFWPERGRPLPTEQSQPLRNKDLNKVWVEIIINGLRAHDRSHAQINMPECSIFKAPPDISQFDSEAYEPKVITIGPYHHRGPYSSLPGDAYEDMQRCKWRCLGSLISRHEGTPADDLVSRCFAKMTSHEERILSYYAQYDPNSMTSEDLALVMVLDGCFILQILLDPDHFQERPHNRVIGRLWIWTLVRYDLLLLENQIPFFVLYELLDILGVGDEKRIDLVGRALHYMGDACLPRAQNFSPPKSNQILHLLHLFYMSLLSIDLSTVPPADIIWIPCASELTDFGIKFHKNNEAKSFLDVNFSRRGVMEVPPLLIDDHSKNLLRNLIAFEQCYPGTGCHISVYASFMECIMNSEKDVRLLHWEGILVNRMSADQDITRFFSNLCKGVHIARDRFYLANLFTDVTVYKDDTFNKCVGEFKQTYCSNSWVVFAAVVSVFFAVLTIVQTFYAFYPYYYPRN